MKNERERFEQERLEQERFEREQRVYRLMEALFTSFHGCDRDVNEMADYIVSLDDALQGRLNEEEG